MLTEETAPLLISDEHQSLLRTLKTRRKASSENDVGEGFKSIDSFEELEEVYGIPFIVLVFFFSFSFLHIYLNLPIAAAHPRVQCSSHICME